MEKLRAMENTMPPYQTAITLVDLDRQLGKKKCNKNKETSTTKYQE